MTDDARHGDRREARPGDPPVVYDDPFETEAAQVARSVPPTGLARWRGVPAVAVGATLGGLLVTAVTTAVLWPTTPDTVITPVGFGQNRAISRPQALAEALCFFVLPLGLTVAAVLADRRAARLHEDLRGRERNVAITCAAIAAVLAVLLTLNGIRYFASPLGG